MQTLLVILIIIAAAFFLIRRFYKSLTGGGQSTCGCSCDGCSPKVSNDCDQSAKRVD